MNKVLSLFFLFFSITTFGQSFEWGVTLHPNFSNRRLIALGLYSEEDIVTIDSMEAARPSYSGGVFANWQNEKIGLYVGVNYMSTGYRSIKNIILPDDPLSQNYTHQRFVYENRNIEIPIILQFIQRPDEKNAIYFNLGTAISYNVQNKNSTIFYTRETQFRDDIYEPEIDDFRRVNYAFQTGFGWKRTLDNGMAVTLEPVFVMWIKGILKSNDLNRSIYSLGIRTSFSLGGYDRVDN
jgi:hypothetical protein